MEKYGKLSINFTSYPFLSEAVIKNIQYVFAVYSNAIQENMNALLYPGFIEELVDIVELPDDKIVVSHLYLYTFSCGQSLAVNCTQLSIFIYW